MVLLDIKVNEPWKQTSEHLDKNRSIGDNAVFIGDADKEMRNALVSGNREFQLDFIHIFRDVGIKLWMDGKLGLNDRKIIVKRMESILYPLKNSVRKHIENGDTESLKAKINYAIDKLKTVAKDVAKSGCIATAAFIRDYSNLMVTFARLAVEKGRSIPWNSNTIERLMGEISKRTKHKWMRWTTRGLGAILNIILTRYASEQDYEIFKAKIMRSANLTYIKCETIIMSVGGEF
ncbi:MAG: hypothetical protein CVT48_02950 [Thermoplasmata archaeon HGW-Thermoplasmata-1]|nr:MAG: hypothetical protein CVT48_02950 [Thermoplasmata archaeon HGW-Thermoplasmata-1]